MSLKFEFPNLPYAKDALEPHISSETLDFHYGKHHKSYYDKLVAASETDPSLKEKTLEEIVKSSSGGVFNNAAQVWNHTFYWNCLNSASSEPSASLLDQINKDFGSLDQFKADFSAKAAGNFGSGWTWLVTDGSKLSIVNTTGAGCPLTDGLKPLLTCDVWEHAYYIDYRNARPKYLEAFWKLVNWDFVASNLG